ncbi:uncharacterized protein PSFLO_01999 [Pseudozyma flocculosa]|uniref:Uncharacterized protein n=1 Tax=Pseudozyma flocculosa TaxID=84751 RepID=A0A5C3EWD6_9BASI|nr:uncharacterized protein PSFLO_01999 [Pseudozyma flocculosa]
MAVRRAASGGLARRTWVRPGLPACPPACLRASLLCPRGQSPLDAAAQHHHARERERLARRRQSWTGLSGRIRRRRRCFPPPRQLTLCLLGPRASQAANRPGKAEAHPLSLYQPPSRLKPIPFYPPPPPPPSPTTDPIRPAQLPLRLLDRLIASSPAPSL